MRWLVLCVMMSAGVFWGCEQAPVSFDLAEAPVATKKAKNNEARSENTPTIYIESASGILSAKGGKIKVDFPQYATNDEMQVHSVEFDVPKNALNKNTEITMDVYSGTSLEDIQVVFGPSGTQFSPPATLTIKMSGKVKLEELVAYHYSEGDVTDAVQEKKSGWKVTLEVPGFSRYSLGGDR